MSNLRFNVQHSTPFYVLGFQTCDLQSVNQLTSFVHRTILRIHTRKSPPFLYCSNAILYCLLVCCVSTHCKQKADCRNALRLQETNDTMIATGLSCDVPKCASEYYLRKNHYHKKSFSRCEGVSKTSIMFATGKVTAILRARTAMIHSHLVVNGRTFRSLLSIHPSLCDREIS